MSGSRTRCPRCGTANPASRLFCKACGTRLATRQKDLPATPLEQFDGGGYETIPPPERAPRRRNAAPAAVALLLVLLVGAGGAGVWWWWQRPASEQTPAAAVSEPAQATPSLLPTASVQPALPTASPRPDPATAPAASPQPTTTGGIAAAPAPTLAGPVLPSPVPAAGRTPQENNPAANVTATAIVQRTDIARAMDEAATIAARIDETTTAILGRTSTAQAQITPSPLETVALFELPVYPGALLADASNPFVQSVIMGLRSQQASGQVDVSVYTVPPGVTGPAVANYYINELVVNGWTTTGLQDMSTVDDDVQQSTIAWYRHDQRFVVALVSGSPVDQATGGGAYLVLTLITGT